MDCDEYDGTDMFVAARIGDVDALEELIGDGEDVNQVEQCLWTPLHFASINNEIEAMKVLLRAKADVDAETNKGNSCLSLAIQRCHRDAVRLLLESNANVGDAIKYAAKENSNVEIIKLLVEFKAQAQSVQGAHTALHYAANNGSIENVRFLVEECGIDLWNKNEDDETALDMANQNKDVFLQMNLQDVKDYLKELMSGGENGPNMTKYAGFLPATERSKNDEF